MSVFAQAHPADATAYRAGLDPAHHTYLATALDAAAGVVLVLALIAAVLVGGWVLGAAMGVGMGGTPA